MKNKKDEKLSTEEMQRKNIEYEYNRNKKYENRKKNLIIVIVIFGIIILADMLRMILTYIFK